MESPSPGSESAVFSQCSHMVGGSGKLSGVSHSLLNNFFFFLTFGCAGSLLL